MLQIYDPPEGEWWKSQPVDLCPYCGGGSFQNSWGQGNARCSDCGCEFNVRAGGGKLTGEPIETKSC